MLSGVTVRWNTLSELDLLGFNLYRSESLTGKRTQLNCPLIAAHLPDQDAGSNYWCVDASAQRGATLYYWIEMVMKDGHIFVPPLAVATPWGVFMPAVLWK